MFDLVFGPRVIEARLEAEAEGDRAVHHFHPPDQRLLATILRFGDHHEIGNLGHAPLGQEPVQQHIGVGQVQAGLPHVLQQGLDLEPAALLRVSVGAEHRGGVEFGEAEEVQRTAASHQRGGFQIADDAIVLDGGVGIGLHANL